MAYIGRFYLLVMTGLLLAIPLSSQVPATISYQGAVEGVTGSVDLVFRLYSSEVGGTLLWSEEHSDVPLSETNTFSLDLGQTSPMTALAFDRPYYLEIVVEGNVMTPRTRMTASPFARRAATANSLANGALRPEAVAAGGGLPADGEVLAFDGGSGLFRWRPVGSGEGGAIEQLAEGDGIRIDDLLGPVPTIHIRENGIVGSMIADTSVTDRVLKTGSITTRVIADSSLTTAKFAPGVGLPNVGTAGGDLIGNYPNPQIRDSAVKENALARGSVTTPKIAEEAVITDHIKDGTIIGADVNNMTILEVKGVEASEEVIAPDLEATTIVRTPELVAKGAINAQQTRVVNIQGISTTANTTPLEIVDSGGSPLLKVRDDRTIGIGTSTPTAALEITKPGGAGLQVTNGSTAFSIAGINAGPTITIPGSTTIVRVNDDGVVGLPNNTTLPGPNSPGELLIIINSDADPLTLAGMPPIAAGTTGMYVSVAGGAWIRIN